MSRYVAKISDNLGKLFEYELSPRFNNIAECQQYIDTTEGIIIIEYCLQSAFSKLLLGNHYEKGEKQYKYSFGGSFVRVYDLVQERFITGFDL